MVEADGLGGSGGGGDVAGYWVDIAMSDNLFWPNRIVDTGAADPQQLAKGMNPLNWRGHPEAQREALEEALDSIGFIQRVLVNRTTGRVIDGHLRIELAVLKGQDLIPVDYVELTEDEEALALATLDAITEQAEPIPDKLAALLERTRALTADRPGLGAMLERLKLRAGMNGQVIDPMAEWKGMPEFEQGDAFGAEASIKVHFASELDIEKFAQLVGQTVTKNTTFIWFPKREEENLKAYRAVDES